MKKKDIDIIKQFHENFCSKTLRLQVIKSFFTNAKCFFDAS